MAHISIEVGTLDGVGRYEYDNNDAYDNQKGLLAVKRTVVELIDKGKGALVDLIVLKFQKMRQIYQREYSRTDDCKGCKERWT